MDNPLWPLYGLRLRTPALELRLPTEDELVELCRVARAGIHDPATMPFQEAWTDQPSPQFERSFLQHHWANRAQWTSQRWRLGLAAFQAGQPVGFQDVAAENFPVLREVHTGSWLGSPFQGRGLGRQMRAAVLALAFEGLAAELARSAVLAGNDASLAVSRALGYQENGRRRVVPRGEPVERTELLLTRQRWQEHRSCPVTVEGLESCRDMFGA